VSDRFLDPLFRQLGEASEGTLARLGTVTEIDATNASLTVDCAGDVIPGMRWYSHYTPVVGDLVDVLCVGGSSWRVLGKLSKQLGSTVAYGSVELNPAAAWAGVFAEDVWSWQTAPTAGILGGPPGQGKRTPYGVAEVNNGIWRLPSLTPALPAGSTVTSAKLRLTRWTPNAEQEVLSPEQTLVTPRLYAHAYSAPPGGSGAPSWGSSVWSPGALSRGASGVWDLPSSWLTAMLAGTALGVGVASLTLADWTRWASVRLDVSYSVPS
jgi:hypothetical protein